MEKGFSVCLHNHLGSYHTYSFITCRTSLKRFTKFDMHVGIVQILGYTSRTLSSSVSSLSWMKWFLHGFACEKQSCAALTSGQQKCIVIRHIKLRCVVPLLLLWHSHRKWHVGNTRVCQWYNLFIFHANTMTGYYMDSSWGQLLKTCFMTCSIIARLCSLPESDSA